MADAMRVIRITSILWHLNIKGENKTFIKCLLEINHIEILLQLSSKGI